MATLRPPVLVSSGPRPHPPEMELGQARSLASSRHHSRSFRVGEPAQKSYDHYTMLRTARPGPLLDRLYVRIGAPVGIVAPPEAGRFPDFARLPLGALGEAVREAAKSTAGVDALDQFVRSAGRPGDPLALVRRAVALRALGKLTREEAIQAYAVYLRERRSRPELEKVVEWLL